MTGRPCASASAATLRQTVMPPVQIDVGLHDVDRAARDQLAEAGQSGGGLVAGDRDVEGVRDLGAAGDVLGGDRLLQPGDVLVRHRGA